MVNQELLLERMRRSAECDQLLVDHEFGVVPQHHHHHHQLIGLDAAGPGASRSAQNVPVEGPARTAMFAPRPSSLLMECESAAVAAASHARNNSLTCEC